VNALTVKANGYCAEISVIFDALDIVNPSLCRGLKMFFFKQIERRKGISFLRGAMLESPLARTAWLEQWKRSGDVSFSRFLGSNKVIYNYVIIVVLDMTNLCFLRFLS
jgi:hypothetical protein